MITMKIALASNNQGKVKEFQQLLGHDVELITMTDLGLASPDETGLTFVENALIKAQFVARHANMPTIADDSGLCVPALNGEPGLYSSRYAGFPTNHQNNMAKLLTEMDGLSAEQRGAYFYCIIVMIQCETDPTPIIGEGRWDGQILLSPQGTRGFGYDPVFQPNGYDCSAAELDALIKNQLSHRYQALQALRSQLV